MPAVYLDTSALGRVLLDEPDAPAIVGELERFDAYVASRLMAVELRRLATRHERDEAAERLLGGVSLVPVTETVLRAAEMVAPASVATLDAIHLATALDLARARILDSVMTYDHRLAEGATAHRLTVIAPR